MLSGYNIGTDVRSLFLSQYCFLIILTYLKMQKKNLDWMKYNRWTVISDWEILMTQKKNWKQQPIRMLKCQCECWTIREIRQWNLINWSSKSCGCHHKDVCRELIKELHKIQKWEWNPNWKWWIQKESSKKRNKERNTKDSRVWRKKVLKRDWMCIVCWEVNNLQAHHLNDWKNNILLRIDEQNWVCLCKYCHHIFHKIYWFWNNTPEQFKEFLSSREE